MSTLPFVIALAGLVIGTYILRYVGVRIGSMSGTEEDTEEPTPARLWMDRATVVLICAVAATTMVFEGQDVAGPARIIGTSAGIIAAIVKVPLLICVILGMATCAALRLFGVA
ncbi:MULTISPECIES: AzlD domain-containing protein [Micrococcaceae]|uniref:AzlD domain-containing protein n=1 Tax=unclassified Kocuria TaxID=2649579 RepID=UPI001010D45A|nr:MULTISPECIES: AzlD domain-containing protein [unclassified Kocuria]